MARRIDSWQTDNPVTPLTANTPTAAAPSPHGSAPTPDAAEQLAVTDRATCDCPDFRRDKVCDHLLMAAAVRMVRRMIEAQKPH
jgi:hypothetical protein